jgi:hypothetical protein
MVLMTALFQMLNYLQYYYSVVSMFVTECLLANAEFSEALEELGGCFLAKTALNGDDDDSGKHMQIYGVKHILPPS